MTTRTFAVALLACVLLVSPLSAQEATLGGRVVDGSDGVVPGAAVVLTEQGTSVSAETVTNGSGYFSFPSARPGIYGVSVSLNGFATARMSEIRLEVGQNRDIR